MSETKNLLLTQFKCQKELTLIQVADLLFNGNLSKLKQQIKSGELPKFFKDNIKNDTVPIDCVAHLIDHLRELHSASLPPTKPCISKTLLIASLGQEFGSAIIPFTTIADKYFGWKEKTAKAKLASGEVNELGLITFKMYNSTQAPAFVNVIDLVNFISARRAFVFTKDQKFYIQ